MKVGSLFTGIGGIDLGLERAGMETAFQCEIDKDCNRILENRYPNVRRHTDVKEVGRGAGSVDVLVGGFPCQDLSVAGRRAGLVGERSGLFHEFMRVASELTPRWLLIENVPGLLSSNDGRDMGVVVSTLAELGYGWAYRVLDAQYFGVAQRRRRVFIVGCLGDPALAAQVLFDPSSGPGNPAPSRSPGPDVARTLGPRSADARNARGDGSENFLLDDPGARESNGGERGPGKGFATAALTGNGVGTCGVDDNQAQAGHLVVAKPPLTKNRLEPDDETLITAFSQKDSGDDATEDISPTLRSMNHDKGAANGGGQVAVVITPETGQGSDLVARETDVASALSATDGKQHDRGTRITDSQMIRRLTPLECERLQGFPDEWTKVPKVSDSARYRMLGNAVCVNVAEWIGHRIVGTDEGLDGWGENDW